MATEEQLQMLTGRALLDPQFLDYLLKDPQGAAAQFGIYLTEDQIEGIQYFQKNQSDLQSLVDQLYRMRHSPEQIVGQPPAAIPW